MQNLLLGISCGHAFLKRRRVSYVYLYVCVCVVA